MSLNDFQPDVMFVYNERYPAVVLEANQDMASFRWAADRPQPAADLTDIKANSRIVSVTEFNELVILWKLTRD